MEFIKPLDDVKIRGKEITFTKDWRNHTVLINKMINSGIMRMFIKSNEKQSHSTKIGEIVQYSLTK
jgi:hypothetical protein